MSTATTTFVASEGELELVHRIYERAGCSRPGFISGNALVDIFTASVDLTPFVLSQIWNIADEDKTGNLSERGLAIALRLIGWAQRGESVDVALVNMHGALPHIEGVTPITKVESSPRTSESTLEVGAEWPSFPPHSKEFFTKLFHESGPINGLLHGDKVRDIFLQTKLPPQDLWQIWNLADAQNRGALDSDDFVLGMYLLQGAASGKISPIPTSIPAHLKQQIFEAPLRNTDPTPSILSTPSQSIPKIVIHPAVDPIIISPAIPRGEKRPLTPEKTPYHDWDITPLDKTKADQDFDILDAQKRNYIEGDVLGKYMLRFKLSPEDLAHIWDLADLNGDNCFTRDGFAVAMYLIGQRLSGSELPFALPLSLIPPSMRPRQATRPPTQGTDANHQEKNSDSPTSPQRRPPPPLPPKPVSPLVGAQRRRTVSVAQPKVMAIASPSSPSPQLHRAVSEQQLSSGNSIPLDQYRNLEREKSALKSKVDDLSIRFEAQQGLRAENVALKEENLSLSEKLQDMEQTVSQLLQVAERLSTITRENAVLTGQVAELEPIRTRLEETLQSLETSTQENKELSTRLWDARESAEAAATRSAEQIEELTRRVEQLEEENEGLRGRAVLMERSISQSEPPGSATNMHEMEILMGDVTLENERVKRQLRRMQRSTAHLMLTSSTAQSVNDDLRRENQRLAVQVQELEQLTNQMQSSSDDGMLQRVLRDMTQENEDLKARVRDMREEASRVSSSRVQELETEVAGFREEVGRLRTQLQSAAMSGPSEEEDSSVPPPAYDAGAFC